MARPALLYKRHEDPDCATLQNIVRYLFKDHAVDKRPVHIVERNMSADIIVPTIELGGGVVLAGLQRIVQSLETELGVTDLVAKSAQFAAMFPDYRIRDPSTHK